MSRSLHVLVDAADRILEQYSSVPPVRDNRSHAWGVVYAPPNPDGSRKKCGNCWMWVTTGRCLIHERNLPITKDHTCGYHNFGKPRKKWMDMGQQAQLPEHSGLEKVKGGTSCDTCREYRPQPDGEGRCRVVIDELRQDAEVDPLGCCARWVGKTA